MPSLDIRWLNAMGFQLAWFSCLLLPGAAALVTAALFVALHGLWSLPRKRYLRQVMMAAILGMLVDLPEHPPLAAESGRGRVVQGGVATQLACVQAAAIAVQAAGRLIDRLLQRETAFRLAPRGLAGVGTGRDARA